MTGSKPIPNVAGNIIRVIRSRKMRWKRDAVFIEEVREKKRLSPFS
jgi:hypothetical protein